MAIAQIITLVNQMVADGVIDRYAIGGAVGATFYLEPVATLDVVIFVTFRPEPGRLLVSPQPILDYLTATVFTAEHLAVIALQTGRAKDKARLLQFIEAGVLLVDLFQSILLRHSLAEAWQEFERTFLKDKS